VPGRTIPAAAFPAADHRDHRRSHRKRRPRPGDRRRLARSGRGGSVPETHDRHRPAVWM